MPQTVNEGKSGVWSSPSQIYSRTRRGNQSVEICDYDFSRSKQFGHDRIHSLRKTLKTFSGELSAVLAGLLRTSIDVGDAELEVTPYARFSDGVPNPSCVCTATAPLHSGFICCEMSLQLVYSIVDRLLGGSIRSRYTPSRAMSPIESRLMRYVFEKVMHTLSNTWPGHGDYTFQLQDVESNAEEIRIVKSNDFIVLSRFHMSLGECSGKLTLVMPMSVLESCVDCDGVIQSKAPSAKTLDKHSLNALSMKISRAVVELSGEITRASITVAELRSLAVGDIIKSEHRTDEPVLLAVGSKSVVDGELGHHRGRRSLKVGRRVINDSHAGSVQTT